MNLISKLCQVPIPPPGPISIVSRQGIPVKQFSISAKIVLHMPLITLFNLARSLSCMA